MGLHPLLGDRLSHALAVSAFELPGEEVTQPPLQQWGHAPHKEEPHPPARGPETTAGTLTNRAGVEPIVDDVLEVLAHPDLLHELVLVPVHTGELTDMGHGVLNTVG